MLDATRRTLVSRLSRYEMVVEVGIGERTALARSLATAGVAVTATDVRERTTPPGVSFVLDDVTAPQRDIYADADALYALNLPPELHRPALTLALDVDAALLFTTLGGDQPLVPVDRETLPEGMLYVARDA